MSESILNSSSEPCNYDDKSAFPQPHRKLFRSWLRRPRPVRQFAPRIDFDLQQVNSDPDIAAQWGEHIFIEDYLIVLHRDGSSSTWRHLVSRLHSSEALANWDEVLRSYDSRSQYLNAVKAKLYFSDGSTRNASSTLHKVPIPDQRPNQAGRTLQLIFAPLRPGVIVELEEQFEDYSPGLLWPAIWESFFLETGSPCRHRRFTVAVAKPFTLFFNVHHGAPPPKEQFQEDYHIFTWEVRDSEGIEFDEWSPPIRDFAPWVDVSTISSWSPFAAKFLEELEPGYKSTAEVQQLAKELTADKTGLLEKACAAYTYVARTVRYGRPLSEAEQRNIRGSNQMFEDLRGDCKDKSALLVQLLRAMNLSAQVAVILTGDTGRTPFLPSTRFNHAIVKLMIEEKTHWLDAASGEFAFGELPPVDQDISALVLNQDTFNFEAVPAASTTNYLEYRDFKGVLNENGDFEGTVTVTLTGDIAAHLRSQLYERNFEHRQKVLQAWLGSDYSGSVGSEFAYESSGDLSGSIVYKCAAKIPLVARRIKSILLLQIQWAGKLMMSGPMAQEVRRQPLALPRAHKVYERQTVKLPNGFTPIAIPEKVVLNSPWGNYSCSWQPVANQLVCERELHLAGSLVGSGDFPKFKEFWRQASWADSTPLVLQESGFSDSSQ